jgi:hypothetical protein
VAYRHASMIGEQEADFRWSNSLREDFLGSLPAVERSLARGRGGRAVGFVLAVLVIALIASLTLSLVSYRRDFASGGRSWEGVSTRCERRVGDGLGEDVF